MILFIDHLPFYSWIDTSGSRSVRRWSVCLPIIPSEATREAPSEDMPFQRWVLDTAFGGEAYAWRSHLQAVGLNPRIRLAALARQGLDIRALVYQQIDVPPRALVLVPVPNDLPSVL